MLLAGRSGSGKSTVGYEVSALLEAQQVTHCLLEGDYLDHAWPEPPNSLLEANLAAIWRNYTELGYRRLVYTNSACILVPDMFRRALGAPLRIIPVLLTASDESVLARLSAREIGSGLDSHVRRSAHLARVLESAAPPDTVRIPTDNRPIPEIAHDVVAVTGWPRVSPASRSAP
ncbi:hypothetical protein D5S17_24725 [Pseudonocardiaceae bacterium YIM PH 21723]|nr:hypothetical protein D5S17_24725 [Pseudonocardiaceae bacterium YIM PH 21723]